VTALTDWPVFLGLTICIFGASAWLTGAAIAATWRPFWQAVAYGLLLTFFDRFLAWSLFGGPLMSLADFVRDFAVIALIGLLSWRISQVQLMVGQYPWLYEKAGLLNWRARVH
jgi:hypothetical protein